MNEWLFSYNFHVEIIFSAKYAVCHQKIDVPVDSTSFLLSTSLLFLLKSSFERHNNSTMNLFRQHENDMLKISVPPIRWGTANQID